MTASRILTVALLALALPCALLAGAPLRAAAFEAPATAAAPAAASAAEPAAEPASEPAATSVSAPAAAPAAAPESPPGPATVTAPPASADWRATVRAFAAQHFKNPAWGYSHCVRDYTLARDLAAADHVALDDDVLYAAAYLHDMAAFPPWEKKDADHADEAARIVDTVLAGTGFPMAKIDAVRGAIRTHMYDRSPAGPEAVYLHDADALDWLGAIGVARVIALADPNGADPDGPAVVKMLGENLADVPARVLSPAGRALVPARRVELEAFLKDLRRESDDLRAL